MSPAPRLVTAAALVCVLAGCAASIDAGHARLCRSVIPALNPPDAAIDIQRTVPLGSRDALRVDYRARTPAGVSLDRFVECRFAAVGVPERDTLVSVATEAGPMGELRLQLLKRFWLEKEGAAADPAPIANAEQVPAVPRAVAIGLQHLLFALPSIAIYALLAAAYSLVYGLVGRLNLAFGELAAVGGYAAFLGLAMVAPALGDAPAMGFALLLTLASALAYGVAIARFVFAPLMRLTGQQVLIGTIALAIVLQEYLRLAQGAKLLWVRPLLNTPYAVARADDYVVTLTPAALAAAALCLCAALALLGLMQMSRFGRAWRACADDPLAAALFGIDHRAVLLRTFALASALAGLAGYVITVYYGALGYAGGITLGLKALIAAIVGGIGSVPGALLGGILLGSTESLWSALLPIELRDLAVFCLLVVLLVVRPSGLFGLRDPLQPKL
jgi:branched-chain amino acid transport system permease protein